MRTLVGSELTEHESSRPRVTRVLQSIGVATSSWYRAPIAPEERKKPGPVGRPVSPEAERAIVQMATDNPWYGYQRIAVMCRRERQPVRDRDAYRVMRERGMLHRRRPCHPEVHQTAKLFELLPTKPNDLWQMDVTYIHIPGHGWWYAVTVIDYYSRYLLACHLTASYSAWDTVHGLKLARETAERFHGPLPQPPTLVTDNGTSFLAKRFQSFIGEAYRHVRIQYRTPQQLGLLERFHRTLKQEEVYWQLYDSPSHCRASLQAFQARYNDRRPHWALVPPTGGDPLVPREVYVDQQVIQIPRWQTWARAAKQRLEELMQTAP